MQIKYRINSLKESEFRLNFDYKLEDKQATTFEFGHREKADFVNKTILVEANVRIVTTDGETVLAENTVRGTFSIEPFDEVIKDNGDGNSFSSSAPEVIDTFINVTLGALRGIFAKNLNGTYLEGFVLPLIPMRLISEKKKTNMQR